MTENQNLGGFDMVLGLSQSTINFQFKMLYQNDFIRDKWFALVGNVLNPKEGEKPFHFEGSDEELKIKLDRWISLQSDVAEAKQSENWAEFGKLMETIKSEGLNFDYAWDCDLKAPTIDIIDKDTRNLYFNLSFSDGKLYYRPESTSAVKVYDLTGSVYAFTTPIGRIKVKKDQMVLDADNAMDTVLRDSGLKEEDFRIESLFLNFENANISDFDKSRSKFPEAATLPLQIAIENYFNLILKGADNPYVLGYGITQPKINSKEAMFQPTFLTFSSSYSSKTNPNKPIKGQFSALNFLMMLNEEEPPSGPTSGILSSSLIELNKDASSTTDGVFAISESQFERYLRSMDEFVASGFLKESDIDVDEGGFRLKDGRPTLTAHSFKKRIDDKIYTNYTLVRKPLTNVDYGILIEYEFSVRINIHIIAKIFEEIEVKEVDLSTSGKYSYKDVKGPGQVGAIKFLIKNSKEGKFIIEPRNSNPVIAFDKSPNKFEGEPLEVIAALMGLVIPGLGLVTDTINKIALDLGNTTVDVQNKKIKELQKLEVLNQSSRVILPLGKTYAFKNLSFNQEKSLISYDVTYATTNE